MIEFSKINSRLCVAALGLSAALAVFPANAYISPDHPIKKRAPSDSMVSANIKQGHDNASNVSGAASGSAYIILVSPEQHMANINSQSSNQSRPSSANGQTKNDDVVQTTKSTTDQNGQNSQQSKAETMVADTKDNSPSTVSSTTVTPHKSQAVQANRQNRMVPRSVPDGVGSRVQIKKQQVSEKVGKLIKPKPFTETKQTLLEKVAADKQSKINQGLIEAQIDDVLGSDEFLQLELEVFSDISINNAKRQAGKGNEREAEPEALLKQLDQSDLMDYVAEDDFWKEQLTIEDEPG